MRTQLQPGKVHVWRLCEADLDPKTLADAYDHLLTAEERQRYDRYKVASAARSYLATRRLERTTLSRYTSTAPQDWRFRHTAAGRPEIEHPNPHGLRYSLSRSGGMVLMGLTREAHIGVDVQSKEPSADIDQVAGVFCSPTERAWLEAAQTDTERLGRFYVIWTLKEAYLKALGTGLSTAPASVTVTRTGDGAIEVAHETPGDTDRSTWFLYDWAISPDYHAALAIGSLTKPLSADDVVLFNAA